MMAVAEVVPAVVAAARSLAMRVSDVVGNTSGREPKATDRETEERIERTLNALQSGSFCTTGGAANAGATKPPRLLPPSAGRQEIGEKILARRYRQVRMLDPGQPERRMSRMTPKIH